MYCKQGENLTVDNMNWCSSLMMGAHLNPSYLLLIVSSNIQGRHPKRLTQLSQGVSYVHQTLCSFKHFLKC